MNLITPGRIYGSIAALALIAVFVIQPQMDLPGYMCGILSFGQTGCVVGVQVIFRGVILYCLLAGYLISRFLDRRPVVSPWIAPVIAACALFLSGMPLLIGLGLYFH